MGYEKRCLFDYNVEWKTINGSIVATNCLQSHPTWMHDMRNIISTKKIRDLSLAGTHDTLSYTKSLMTYSFFAGTVATQDESLMGQLLWGARYFDIR